MNREIKFRVWDKRFKTIYIPHKKYPKYVINKKSNSQILVGDFIGDKDVELMQFTGLFDKNGKEVFEGDVVKYRNYSDGLNILIEEVKTKRFVNGFMPFNYSLDMDYTTLEVIGNIYEHSDLIK